MVQKTVPLRDKSSGRVLSIPVEEADRFLSGGLFELPNADDITRGAKANYFNTEQEGVGFYGLDSAATFASRALSSATFGVSDIALPYAIEHVVAPLYTKISGKKLPVGYEKMLNTELDRMYSEHGVAGFLGGIRGFAFNPAAGAVSAAGEKLAQTKILEKALNLTPNIAKAAAKTVVGAIGSEMALQAPFIISEHAKYAIHDDVPFRGEALLADLPHRVGMGLALRGGLGLLGKGARKVLGSEAEVAAHLNDIPGMGLNQHEVNSLIEHGYGEARIKKFINSPAFDKAYPNRAKELATQILTQVDENGQRLINPIDDIASAKSLLSRQEQLDTKTREYQNAATHINESNGLSPNSQILSERLQNEVIKPLEFSAMPEGRKIAKSLRVRFNRILNPKAPERAETVATSAKELSKTAREVDGYAKDVDNVHSKIHLVSTFLKDAYRQLTDNANGEPIELVHSRLHNNTIAYTKNPFGEAAAPLEEQIQRDLAYAANYSYNSKSQLNSMRTMMSKMRTQLDRAIEKGTQTDAAPFYERAQKLRSLIDEVEPILGKGRAHERGEVNLILEAEGLMREGRQMDKYEESVRGLFGGIAETAQRISEQSAGREITDAESLETLVPHMRNLAKSLPDEYSSKMLSQIDTLHKLIQESGNQRLTTAQIQRYLGALTRHAETARKASDGVTLLSTGELHAIDSAKRIIKQELSNYYEQSGVPLPEGKTYEELVRQQAMTKGLYRALQNKIVKNAVERSRREAPKIRTDGRFIDRVLSGMVSSVGAPGRRAFQERVDVAYLEQAGLSNLRPQTTHAINTLRSGLNFLHKKNITTGARLKTSETISNVLFGTSKPEQIYIAIDNMTPEEREEKIRKIGTMYENGEQAAAAQVAAVRAMQYLEQEKPRWNASQVAFNPIAHMRSPTAQAMAEYNEKVKGALDPDGTLEAIVRGDASYARINAFKAVYPQTVQLLINTISAESADPNIRLSNTQKAILRMLSGMPVDPSMDSRNLRRIQGTYQQQQQPQKPSASPPTRPPNAFGATAAQRIYSNAH